MRGSWVIAGALWAGCSPEVAPADFTTVTGVETATVLDAGPGDPMTLYDADGEALLTVLADDQGQAHFAYVPDEHTVLDSQGGMEFPIVDGGVLRAGDYEVWNDDAGEWSGPIRVRALDDVAFAPFYAAQRLTGIHSSPLSGDLGDPSDGFQYVQMRDGTLLSVMVRFPDPQIYGEGPYPTVIEYSGYSPSQPDSPDPGSMIANALGFATVGVNMRGTGCSGGVFDVFNRAQHADGYDVVEIVAAQEWVLNHQVGMVGLSYPGISQLYVASTTPPSLAAIVPLSTIADAWEMQWPGGVYNVGFTQQWVGQREEEQQADGLSWVVRQVEGGDTTCEDNIRLSSQSIEFESFLRGLEFRPRDADDRDLSLLVEQITVPVFLGGAWQDEQTGAQFGRMLDRFEKSPHSKFLLYNGRHPDGFNPAAVYRWYEFLEFYVAERIPRMHPAIRLLGAGDFADQFGIVGFTFEADRFAAYSDDQYEEALAAYESEPPVRVLFESGAGGSPVGAPVPRFEASYPSWPPPEAMPTTWYAAPDGALTTQPPASVGADAWTFDAEAGRDTFFGSRGYQLLVPLWDIDWTRFPQGHVASYVTAAFQEDAVVAGPGIADLWVRSPVDDVTVQVTLTEIRPDGDETLVQSGWLRLGHRASDPTDDLRLDRTYSKEDFEPVPVDTWVQARVQIPSFAHPIRAGSALKMSVSSPGRDHGTWEFEGPPYDGEPTFHLGRGGAQASSLFLTLLPGLEVPDEAPPCPSLRGQPCRAHVPTTNVVVE